MSNSGKLPAYARLEARFKRISLIHSVIQFLGWDTATMMPGGSLGTRIAQVSLLESLYNRELTDPSLADLLAEAEQTRAALSEWQAANLREMRREWQYATAAPLDLIAAFNETAAQCEMTWRDARANDDFASFAPVFSTLLGIVRELGQARAEVLGCTSYDALLQKWEPNRTAADIDVFFDDLAAFLPGLFAEASARQAASPPRPLPAGPYPLAQQRQLSEALMAALGFDFARGRLDTSLGPFCAEDIPDDVRITTRYDERTPIVALLPLLHETAHARYELGLPAAWKFQPVGRYRSASFQEGQALLAEMHIARSPEFLEFLQPLMAENFSDCEPRLDADSVFQAVRFVRATPIRAGSDEITYPLHVILRYRVERRLLCGDLRVADLPDAWNELSRQLLGLRPGTEKEGCLQDIHWPKGLFGYFPTYTLGAMTAAQLFAAALEAHPSIPADMKTGDFTRLFGWMHDNVYRYGRLLEPNDLLSRATGEPLSTLAYKSHLRTRYLP